MERNEIEAKDLRLVKRIREIFEQKENPTTLKKAFWKAPGFWLPVLFLGGIVLGLIFYGQRPTTAVQAVPDHTPTAVVEHPIAPVEKRAEQSVASTMLDDAKKVATVTSVDDLTDSASGDEAVRPEPLPIVPGAESNVSEKSIADRSETASEPTVEPTPAETPGVSPDVNISQLVTCGGVQDKQYVSAKSTFSVAADPIAMVWMRVLSKAPPFTLKHVYFHNGKYYCDVPLAIPYPHMRTWSKISINRDSHIGSWRVDVVDDNGEKIDQIAFTVGP